MTRKQAERLVPFKSMVMYGECGPFRFGGIDAVTPPHALVEDEPGHWDRLLIESLSPWKVKK